MEQQNIGMEISETVQNQEQSTDSGKVKLTSEMLSKVQVSVNMRFLADIRNIIEVSTQRGAWKASELTQVGSIVDSLDNAFKQLANKTDEVSTAANESVSREESETQTD